MPPPATALRLVSYNIQKCIGMDLRRRPSRILKVLDDTRADIVVLQEVDKRLPPRPAALPHFALAEAGWQIADLGGAGSLGWHGNAVIWRTPALRLVETGHITLPGLEPRGAVHVRFETACGPLQVFGMHLGLLARSRMDQVRHLAQEAAALPACATVWAGDFNDWSARSPLETVAADMQFLPARPSFPAPRPLGALDRIALGRGVRAVAHGVHAARPAAMASDHLPVWADLLLETG